MIDEPEEAGGADQGPSPTRTLAAALAACTAITIEMYAERKGWDAGRRGGRGRDGVRAARASRGRSRSPCDCRDGLTEEQAERLG